MSWPETNHCSYCYTTFSHRGINVGHWWNNESYLAKVCTQSCKNKLWKLVEEGTWMNHKPAAMFPERAQKKTKGPTALTDKQFGVTLK